MSEVYFLRFAHEVNEDDSFRFIVTHLREKSVRLSNVFVRGANIYGIAIEFMISDFLPR